ncbi:cell division cycle protein 20 homolog [Lytechinus variegatus]|uniref:cell division cycle protein 20 homolog n=1 Tax=Lytechinus variegatus TaxID=7654 RepID=UPI001BB2821B|nr:cell division cycle protein 20 homolog [Lytechinus variegatus]XP_041476282.1 cell division cycle protein 20 homolog [Lytechinus variegatus]
MSHFYTELEKLTKLDGPTGGPDMRWQRKAKEVNGCGNVSMNKSLNKSLNTSSMSPMKVSNRSFSAAKTPSKTPGGTIRSKTPGKGKSKTPTRTPGGDRFIPNRSATNFDLGNFKLHDQSCNMGENTDPSLMSPSKLEYQKAMSENLNGDLMNAKILCYKNKPPSAPEGYQNNLKVMYSHNKTPGSTKKPVRHIPQQPERILDAPDMLDDYYLNLLDWSCHNHLAVALANNVYLWNAASGDIKQLMQLEGPEDYISSVSWITEGNYLAVGTSSGDVQLWDVESAKRLRCMQGHAARVGSLSWNSYILSSGSRSGNIHHHDVRVAQFHVGTLAGHTQEVCGLKWSPDGRYLASGGNDNLLNIWPTFSATPCNVPIYTLNQHQAAVKALAWCPWQPSVLASGGGTADRHIRFWNSNTGSCLNSVDTKSQVCALLWSKEHKELISAHGFAQNQLVIWKYPTMVRIAELLGHTSRILHMSMSPDGTTVVSAAADETLRLWKCFAVDPKTKKEKSASSTKLPRNSISKMQNIR